MFRDVVELYRACERPELAGGSFSFEGASSARLSRAIDACGQLGEQFGRFAEPPENEQDGGVSLTWNLAANEHARFYETISALVNASTRPSQGVPPTAYYLIDDNYAVGETPAPESVVRLERLVTLIQCLARISQPITTSALDPLSLIFVIPAEEKTPPRTIQLETRVTEATVSAADINIGALQRLVDAAGGEQLHVEERTSLFRLAVADVLGDVPSEQSAFTYLIAHWTEVIAKYQYDVDAYISRFSFDKIRKEIAQTELDFVTKIQSVVGESSSKLLGLPLSLAAVIGIYHASALIESMLLCFGALLIALIFSAFTENQRLQLQQVDHAFETVFDPLIERVKSLPSAIAVRLNEAQQAFARQLRFSRRALLAIRILAWIPVLLAVAATAYKFNDPFRDYVSQLATQLLM